ncbi:hypothetical protein [Devosia sp.]|uniref:hypothetical protein n=1 Tax=Devosia sp. TaxID=1871048 RepID=UPI002614D530|nr:hypothetical protein [Devosia sp.]
MAGCRKFSSSADRTNKYPRTVDAAKRPRCTSAILDGAQGAADFSGLPPAIRWRPQELIFVAIDLPH